MDTPKAGEESRAHGASNCHVFQVRNKDSSKVQPWRAWLPDPKDAIVCSEKPGSGWKPDLKNKSAEPWVNWIKSAGVPGAADIFPCEKDHLRE